MHRRQRLLAEGKQAQSESRAITSGKALSKSKEGLRAITLEMIGAEATHVAEVKTMEEVTEVRIVLLLYCPVLFPCLFPLCCAPVCFPCFVVPRPQFHSHPPFRVSFLTGLCRGDRGPSACARGCRGGAQDAARKYGKDGEGAIEGEGELQPAAV